MVCSGRNSDCEPENKDLIAQASNCSTLGRSGKLENRKKIRATERQIYEIFAYRRCQVASSWIYIRIVLFISYLAIMAGL